MPDDERPGEARRYTHEGSAAGDDYSAPHHWSHGSPYGNAPAPDAPSPHRSPPYAPQFGQPYWTPPPVVPPTGGTPRWRKAVVGSLAAAAVTALAVGVGVASAGKLTSTRSDISASQSTTGQSNPSLPDGRGQTNPNGGNGSADGNNDGSAGGNRYSDGSGGSSGSQSSPTTGSATATQQVGVVDINTVLGFGAGKAAGTGIVVTSSGKILTNNHVIDGSTTITVTIVTTGKQYTATVVGTDPTDDVAVLQLQGASGLQTAKMGDSSTVAVGDQVTGVGNAGGVGGTPSAATGTVTALGQSITTSNPDGSNAVRLTDMIQVDAAIVAGDSGGPLYSASDAVIGIDSAANASRYGTTTAGFAIPIAKVVSIANQIESGKETSTIHIGYPAFLGVQLQATDQSNGALIGGVIDGSAAAKAGLQAGDTITAVNGKAVSTASAFSSTLAQREPGEQVQIAWTNSSGQGQVATVTLGTGPAD